MNSKPSVLERFSLPILIVGGILVVSAFICIFTWTPIAQSDVTLDEFYQVGDMYVLNKPLFSQKIFYFHMPVAIISMVALFFTALYGVKFLKTRKSEYDLRAKTATEISLVFVIMTMITGELWERFEWGVWWTWDFRLTTYLVLMLLVIGYFVLRSAVSDPERRATYSSVFGIIAFIDVPICFMITRLIPSSLHPVVLKGDSGMPPSMFVPLMAAMVGFGLLAFALYRYRLYAQELQENVEMLKLHIDELQEK